MMTRLIAVVLVALTAGRALAEAPVPWTIEQGGNGDYYQKVDTTGTFTFEQAKAAAEAMTYNGLTGHLLILDNATYDKELAFVNGSGIYSAGTHGLEIYWIGAFRPANQSISRFEGWSWVNGGSAAPIPTSITTRWIIDQAEGPGDEGAVLFDPGRDAGDYGTADLGLLVKGYLVEYGNNTVPIDGDADRNGRVDADDFAAIDRGYAKHLTGWSNGDFNADGSVNSSDYAIINQAFATQGGYDAGRIAPMVPEPAMLGELGLIGFTVWRRTRLRFGAAPWG